MIGIRMRSYGLSIVTAAVWIACLSASPANAVPVPPGEVGIEATVNETEVTAVDFTSVNNLQGPNTRGKCFVGAFRAGQSPTLENGQFNPPAIWLAQTILMTSEVRRHTQTYGLPGEGRYDIHWYCQGTANYEPNGPSYLDYWGTELFLRNIEEPISAQYDPIRITIGNPGPEPQPEPNCSGSVCLP